MTYRVPHYINGKARQKISRDFHSLYNPARGEIIGQVYFADQTLCDEAIAAAKAAWPAWAQTTPLKRARILFKFRELLDKYQMDLARLITKENGKILADAKGSVARAIEVVEFHCGLVTQLQGELSTEVAAHIDCYTFRQSLGVCAGISPFNFPVMVPVWMLIPAIACGNTFILKPSEQDPSAALYLIELLYEAGVPNGVVNCIHGDKKVVEQLLKHPDIAAITAVASTPVAQTIYTTAIAHGKRAHTFGGAKNHCVVMPDADFDYAAKAIVGAAFGSAGERCMAIAAVVMVGEETATILVEKMMPLINAIRIDEGIEENAHSDMGPVISKIHRQRIVSAIEKGEAEGATLLLDGRVFKHKKYPEGFFIGPSLFDEVTEAMSVYQTEIFGPVLVLLRVANFEEALALVNRNQYGNGTAIFTRDGCTAREYSQSVQVGMVGINIAIPVPIVSHPFGGWKQSFFGDAPMHGKESINFYTRCKTITSKWPFTQLAEGSSFTMPIHQ